jgi:chromosome segregation ATPase
MRNSWFLLPLLLLAALAARADGAPEQAAVAHAPAAVRLKQQLRKHGAEVAQLELEVGRQESRSREAGRRLDEQDRRIAELQRQLGELAQSRSGAAAGQ